MKERERTEAISDNSLGQGVVISASTNSDGKPVIDDDDLSRENTAQLRFVSFPTSPVGFPFPP